MDAFYLAYLCNFWKCFTFLLCVFFYSKLIFSKNIYNNIYKKRGALQTEVEPLFHFIVPFYDKWFCAGGRHLRLTVCDAIQHNHSSYLQTT